MKETESDRKPNCTEAVRESAGEKADRSTDSSGQHEIVTPGKSTGCEIFSPDVEEGPAGDERGTRHSGRLKVGSKK